MGIAIKNKSLQCSFPCFMKYLRRSNEPLLDAKNSELVTTVYPMPIPINKIANKNVNVGISRPFEDGNTEIKLSPGGLWARPEAGQTINGQAW